MIFVNLTIEEHRITIVGIYDTTTGGKYKFYNKLDETVSIILRDDTW